MNNYEEYIFKSRYARYLPEEKRRETWDETVDRYINYFQARTENNPKIPWKDLRAAIYDRRVMPSMRALMTAGPALDRDNVAGYNCAYVAIDDPRRFDEILYVLMCGTGVGFSVERQYINKLPEVAEEQHNVETCIQVRDSKIGWASATRQLISLLYSGQRPQWDLSKLRPAGSPLKTFGGRSSGPEPLDELFKFLVGVFNRAGGRRLNSVEVHDIVCKIAQVVVCGGVRRSALLSLSNLTDQRMQRAKMGEWYHVNPQRALANNSVAYTERPDMGIWMEEWLALYQSKAGERGIFNRPAAQKMVPDRRDPSWEFGTNPCSEIILRPQQFCNLSEVIIRPQDSKDDILEKVGLATILGTLQATLTDFRYLSKGWTNNTAEERLLGVSLTGIMDNINMANPMPDDLEDMRNEAIETNQVYAKILGIPESTAITCVKPSGTVSQLCGTSSGIHPRYAHYYIRRVRADVSDPLCEVLRSQGVPVEPANQNPRELVFSFPIKSPLGALCVKNMTALRQLETWKIYAKHYCEHKPSVSIYVREHEWLEVAAWLYANWEIVNGLSFFPYDDHIYPQAPYEEITKEKYEELMETFPSNLDLNFVEEYDVTTASQEMACVGGACEL